MPDDKMRQLDDMSEFFHGDAHANDSDAEADVELADFDVDYFGDGGAVADDPAAEFPDVAHVVNQHGIPAVDAFDGGQAPDAATMFAAAIMPAAVGQDPDAAAMPAAAAILLPATMPAAAAMLPAAALPPAAAETFHSLPEPEHPPGVRPMTLVCT